MHTDQIDRTRVRIRDLARSASHAEEYRQGMLHLVGDVVPWDGAVLTALDPATHLVTAATLLDLDSSLCATAMEIELAERDSDPYTALARQTPGVAVLSRTVEGDMARSARYRELYRPVGLHDELRAVARSGGSCWGALSLARRPGHNFTGHDIAAMAALEDAIADGLRVMLLRAVAGAASDRPAAGPAVIVLDAGGEVDSCTAEALDLLAGLSWREVDLPALLLPVRTAAARLRRSPRDVAGVRLRAVDGSWLLVLGVVEQQPVGAGVETLGGDLVEHEPAAGPQHPVNSTKRGPEPVAKDPITALEAVKDPITTLGGAEGLRSVL